MKDLHERMLSAIDAYFSAENREEELRAEDMLLDVRNEIRKQPAQQPLTDERIEECMKQAYATVQGRNLERAFARAIEQAHGITGEKK